MLLKLEIVPPTSMRVDQREAILADGRVIQTEDLASVQQFIPASDPALPPREAYFSEFETLLEANSQKGVSSLVQLLAKFDPEWLYLLLTSPVIVGGVKRTVGH